MKIALLHLDLAGGPRDKNESLLLHASKRAAEKGASIIVTPETALEGYYFYMRDPPEKEFLQPVFIHKGKKTIGHGTQKDTDCHARQQETHRWDFPIM